MQQVRWHKEKRRLLSEAAFCLSTTSELEADLEEPVGSESFRS